MGLFDSDYFDTSGGGSSLSDTWGAALNFGGSDGSWLTPRTTDTVPSNALQSMTPVTASSDGGGWTDFWKGTLQSVIGYSIQKDAVQSGVVRPTNQNGQPVAVQTVPAASGGLRSLLLIGGLVFVGMHLAK